MSKAIITTAITGSIHTPSMSPHLPVTPDQIAAEAIRAREAGAAVVHIHVRDPQTGRPVPDLELFGEVITKIKSKTDVVICITTGGGLGQTTEERVAAVRKYSPELASLNGGSINFALFHALDVYKDFKYDWEQPYLAMTEDFIFPNTFKTLREFSRYFGEEGTKPEFEIYDAGMLNNLAFLIEKGHIQSPVYLQFVLGILGGMQATMNNIQFLYNSAKEIIGNFQWSVCAAGKHQFRMCTASLLMGGNVRVGLEDNLYLEKGVKAKSGAEQVEKIIRIAKELGIEPATPDEARNILNLKGLDKVRF
ncbi:MAG: 3-keto-5-aminohexanoate cleavage protein [Deltaproteobacteria bacterium]|nr:MAG: 3-keto-5-aminohexanoate cleavage protein [Deltaproteobacteria bacterium]